MSIITIETNDPELGQELRDADISGIDIDERMKKSLNSLIEIHVNFSPSFDLGGLTVIAGLLINNIIKAKSQITMIDKKECPNNQTEIARELQRLLNTPKE